MTVRGWVQACEWQPRGTELTADAAIGATVIVVEDPTDFDDAGGIISINDQTISYDKDAVDDDAGTIYLNTGLAAAATVGDRVYAYSGGQIMRDVVLFVACGDGDLVEVIVPWSQRDYWPEGDYEDDPVQVLLSDDLEDVIDAPGRIPKSTELAGTRGGYDGTLQDIYDAADAAAAAAADAAANATTAMDAANGKNKVWVSLSGPGSTPNTAGDIWWQKDSATQTIIGQWNGLGGTSWQSAQVASAVIANLDAGKLVAGSAFINGLSVKTNFTLGDASTNGVIQSYNFAGSSVGVYIDKYGLVAKGGSLAGASITGSTIDSRAGAGTGPLLNSSGLTMYFGGSPVAVWNANGNLQVLNVSTPSSGDTLTLGPGSGLSINTSQVTSHVVLHAYRLETDISTTSSAANTHMDANGRLFKSTSSLRYKTPVRKADLDAAADALLELDGEVYTSNNEDTDTTREHVGWYAERLHELEALRPWVDYDAEGRPDGIGYGQIVVPLLALVQRQGRDIADLRRDMADLKARFGAEDPAG